MEINTGNCIVRQFKSKHETKISEAENLLKAIGGGNCTFSSSCLHIFLLRGKENCNITVVAVVQQ